MGKLQISKLDAVKRQLEVAVKLFFFDGDPVSLHTLVAAAYNLLRDVNRHLKGEPLFVKEAALDRIRPEKRDEFYAMVNEAENFFKHADRDPGETLLFHTAQTKVLLWDACRAYRLLTEEITPTFQAFEWWIFLEKPEMFDTPAEFTGTIQTLKEATAGLSKREFYFVSYEAAVKNSTPA